MPELCLGSFHFEMVSRVVKIVSGVISGVIVLTIIIVIAIFASKNNSTESEQGKQNHQKLVHETQFYFVEP